MLIVIFFKFLRNMYFLDTCNLRNQNTISITYPTFYVQYLYYYVVYYKQKVLFDLFDTIHQLPIPFVKERKRNRFLSLVGFAIDNYPWITSKYVHGGVLQCKIDVNPSPGFCSLTSVQSRDFIILANSMSEEYASLLQKI